MKKIVSYLAVFAFGVTSLFGADKVQATGSVKVRGMGTAEDGALFGKVEKDSVYVARTNAMIHAITQSIESETDEVRRLFKEGWGKVSGTDRHGADEFIEKQIVAESSSSRFDVDKKTRTVTYFFQGTFDKSRLLSVLGLTGKSDWRPAIFGLLRETTSSSQTMLDAAVSSDMKRLEEAEGKLASTDDSTVKEEVSQIKEKIRTTVEKVSKENKLEFSMSDVGIRNAFAGQCDSTFQSFGFDETVDATQLEGYEDLAKEFASNPNGITTATLNKALAAALAEEVDYVAVVQIDFSFPKKVGVGGQFECSATVTGSIRKRPTKGRLWSTVATIDTVIRKRTAETAQDAKREVAALVARDAAVDMVVKIKNKGKL
jgi:hypothetical protein